MAAPIRQAISWTRVVNPTCGIWAVPSNCQQLISQPSIAPLYAFNRIGDPGPMNPRGRAPSETGYHRKGIDAISRMGIGRNALTY